MVVYHIRWEYLNYEIWISKCEIARIGALKGVRVALYGMYCINLNKEPAKILRIQLSYTIKLEEKKNFNNHTAKIENVLKYEKWET